MKTILKKLSLLCTMSVMLLLLTACGAVRPATASGGLYVLLQRSDIYTIGFVTDTDSLGFCSADGTALSPEKSILLEENMSSRVENNRGYFTYSIVAYGKNNELIAEQSFLYSRGDGKVNITISSDGLIYGGKPTPEEVTPVPQPELSIEAELLPDSRSIEDIPVLNESASEYSSHISIRTNTLVKNPALWELKTETDSDGSLHISEGRCIANCYGEIDELLISAELGEFIPVKGISFTDSNGLHRHFYLSISGYDGSPIITEYIPE